MPIASWQSTALAAVAAATLLGCTVGNGDFGDAGHVGKDSGTPAVDAGHDAGAPPVPSADAGTMDEDAGQEPGPDAGPSTGTQLSDLPDLLATATCSALADCVGHEALLTDLLGGHDCAEVNASVLRNADLASLGTSVEAGRVVFDAAEVAACTDDLAAAGCDARSRRWPASCELMLLGTVADGGDCALDQDCAGDAFCDSALACPGTCTALLPEDALCTNSDDDQCRDGLVCARATGTCVPLGTAADGCGSGMPPCKPGLVCADLGAGAQCTNLAVVYFRALDEACNPGAGNCDPGVVVCGASAELCEPGLVCESVSSTSTDGICRPRTETPGGDCKRAVPNQCPVAQLCDVAPGVAGSCTDRPHDGEPCLDRDPPCAPGHTCIDGTCYAQKDNAQVCVDDRQCYSGTCNANGVCEGPAVCEVP